MCDRHSHAKWHDLAQCDLNPVALLEWIEALPYGAGEMALKARIMGYILGVTGIDSAAMKAALAAERAPRREEP